MSDIITLINRIYDKIMAQYTTRPPADGIPDLTAYDEYYLDILYGLGRTTASDFATAAQITKPAATQIIQKLMYKGYVTKEQNESDKRVYDIDLQDFVKAYFQENYQSFNEIYGKCLRALTVEEKQHLESLLMKIDDSI